MEAVHPYHCQLCSGTEFCLEVSAIKDWEFGLGNTFEYRRCKTCSQVQLHPFPTIEDLKAAYPPYYTAYVTTSAARGGLYDLLYSLKNYFIKRQLRSVIPSGARVLDVGCGNGDFLVRLKSIGAAELEGIDFNEHAVALATAKGIKTYHGVFLDFQGEPRAYDAVIMNHYIEHVLDPIAELQKAKEIIKPGGVLLGELPNFASLDRLLFGRYWGGNHVPRHTFQYDPSCLEKLLTVAGFGKITIDHQLDTGQMAMSIQNLLQRHASDLKSNPRLKHGRMSSFGLLLLALLPIGLAFWTLRQSSVIRFKAFA